MNRTIKFKFWDWNKKEMLEGVPAMNLTIGHLNVNAYIPLQSTGLQDKNGVAVFEGDILETEQTSVRDMADEDPYHRVVKWDNEEGGFTFYWNDNKTKQTSGWKFCKNTLKSNFKIIGNVFEDIKFLR
ncbi:YopX family protein [Candidatus Gracilibacteria bacterium]|nr:YopX family protein [Candidatus Gracilibacteria bacterium]